jgi:hypothetical protein
MKKKYFSPPTMRVIEFSGNYSLLVGSPSGGSGYLPNTGNDNDDDDWSNTI